MFEARKFTHRRALACAATVAVIAMLLFTVSKMGPAQAAGLSPSLIAAPVPVDLPDLTVAQASNFVIPVSVGETTGEGIQSFQFVLVYDPDVIVPQGTPVDVSGTVAEGMTFTTNASTPGILRGVFYSSGVRTGSGTLVKLNFTAVGAAGAVSPLTWQNFMFNERVPAVTATDGSVTIFQGYEGDLGERFTGDGEILSNDVILARRFAVGNISPNPAYNEFQRADMSPYETLGDGQIDSSDVIVARRYASGNLPKTLAGGPTGPITQSSLFHPDQLVSDRAETRLRFVGSKASPGERAAAAIEWTPTGNEAAVLFTVGFDPTVLSNWRLGLPPYLKNHAALTVNYADAPRGIIRVLIDGDASLSMAKSLVDIEFDVNPQTPVDNPAIYFDQISISDVYGDSIRGYFEPRRQTLGSRRRTRR